MKCDQLLEQFPYKLTKAQSRVWEEIKKDLSSEYTMNQLIQEMLDQERPSLLFWP